VSRIKSVFKVLILIIAMFVLSSCAVIDWFGASIDDEEVEELAKSVKDPIERSTPYDGSLKQFGKMLEAYNISPIRVQSKVISNLTADHSLPTNVSRMLITGVNKIGTEVVYIPFDPQYIISEQTTGGNINRTLPQLVIAGGITEYAKNLIEKEREVKMDAKIQKGDFGSKYEYDGGLGYKATQSISRIAFDMHLLNYTTQASIPGTNVSNAVFVRKTNLGWGIGAFFQGMGLTFDYNLTKKQNVYYAIRLLVELSVLESLGRYFDVPYWKCIDGAKPDQAMIVRLKEEYFDLPLAEQILYVKEYLFFHGYDDINRGTSELTANERAIIDKEMKKYNASDYTDLFISLWENVPVKGARKRNREYNRMIARQSPQQAEQYGDGEPQYTEQQIEQAQLPEQNLENHAPGNSQSVEYQEDLHRPPAEQNTQYESPRKIEPPQKAHIPKKNNKEAPVGFGETDW
jgi:hypothetical protein